MTEVLWNTRHYQSLQKPEGSRAQTTNCHRFDSDSWEQLMKFNVKTYLIISPLSGLVIDVSEASTKSRWSTHLRQYEITRIIFYHRFLSFWKDFQNKNPSYLTVKLLQVRQCLHYKKGYFTGIRVKQTSSHQSRREVSNLLVYYFEKSDKITLLLLVPLLNGKKETERYRKKMAVVCILIYKTNMQFLNWKWPLE